MLTALKNFVLLTKENFSPSNITKRYCYSLQINICMRIVFLIYTNPLTSPFSKTAAIAAFEIQGLKFKRYLVLNTLCHFLLKSFFLNGIMQKVDHLTSQRKSLITLRF